MYLKTNRLKQAKVIYQELLKEKPRWTTSSNNLAWIYLQEGNPKETIRVIEAAFHNGAEREYDILDTLGLAYRELKQYPQGRGFFIEALGKAPAGNSEAQQIIRFHLDKYTSPAKE